MAIQRETGRNAPSKLILLILSPLFFFSRKNLCSPYLNSSTFKKQDDACLTLQLCSYWATRFAAHSIPGVDYTIFN